jgi:hypothetical protein
MAKSGKRRPSDPAAPAGTRSGKRRPAHETVAEQTREAQERDKARSAEASIRDRMVDIGRGNQQAG